MALLFFPASSALAETTILENAGFAPSAIWYSKEPFFTGDHVRIYSMLYNSTDKDLSGKAVFSDNGASVGTVSFSIANGRAQDIWVDWTAVSGNHTITAEIIDAVVSSPGGAAVHISLKNRASGGNERFVEMDTDGDRIGNSADTDDDNDGVSDAEEAKTGTNPFLADTDGNGISDRADGEPRRASVQAATQTNQDTTNKIQGVVAPAAVATAAATVNAIGALREHGIDYFTQKVAAVASPSAAVTTAPATQTSQTNNVQKLLVPLSGSGEGRGDVFSLSHNLYNQANVLTPFQSLTFYGNSFFLFLFRSRPAFYTLIALCFLLIVRWIFRKIFLRRHPKRLSRGF